MEIRRQDTYSTDREYFTEMGDRVCCLHISQGAKGVEATCHCGAVRLEVPKPPQDVEVKECNCSICRRTGAVMAYYSPRDVRVSGATDTYVWGDRQIEFHRCKICGNFTHWAPVHKSLDRMGVNVRLMPPELLADLRIPKLDGADTWTVVGERRGI